MNRDYFEGWYYKHQALNNTLAIIPGRARDSAFIQVITDEGSYNVSYPLSQYNRKKNFLHVGNSFFSVSGIYLDIHSRELMLCGELQYKNLTPIRGDIMGPFRYLPMECRHGVVSMRHNLSGSINLNGETLDFTGGIGYIETDCGRSFPKSYTWVQANDFDKEYSIMASVAQIPCMGLHFQGCICAILLEGHEYRLSTYNGVKILRCEPDAILLRQGRYLLDVQIDTKEGHTLSAPSLGVMSRVIKETADCSARFRFSERNTVLFERKIEQTSHEYVQGK